jgi:hypothetical protein
MAPDVAHDKALELLSDPADQEIKAHFDINSPEAVAVKNKIDRWLLPLLVVTVLFQNLDKATLAYGSLMGLKKDTHLHGMEYSWLGSLVYVSFAGAMNFTINHNHLNHEISSLASSLGRSPLHSSFSGCRSRATRPPPSFCGASFSVRTRR